MTKSEYLDWKQHPVTREHLEFFTDLRDDMISALGDGHSLGEHTERETALMVGEIAGLNYFIKGEHVGDELIK